MTNPLIVYARALDCFKSPHNVRTESDAAADAELEANIGETGIVLQNVIGVPVPRKKGCFAIIGGGRRLDRVHSLIAKGILGEDFMLAVLPAKNARDAAEMSLTENYFHLPMNPADECRAFRTIIEREKKAAVDVAKRFGKTERFVLGRLRLAGLADRIFEALRTSQITLEVAQAYASISDVERQAALFDRLAPTHLRDNVHEIRRSLAQGGYRGDDPRALLVGRDAYLAGGGRIDSDLFSDRDSEIWANGDLLDRLAEARLAAAADEVRGREGYGDVRVVTARQPGYNDVYALAELKGEAAPLSEEERARRTAIEAEIGALEVIREGEDDLTEEQELRIGVLEEELGALLDRPIVVTHEQKAGALAFVVIGTDGTPVVHQQLYVAPRPVEVAEGDRDDGDVGASGDDPDGREVAGDDGDGADGARAVPETIAPARPVVSQRLGDELAMMKAELLRVHVASDPHCALDLGTFLMADAAIRVYCTADLGTELRAPAPLALVNGFASGMPAAAAWAELETKLDDSWTGSDKVTERYDAFCALDEVARAAWLGWAIARTLKAIPAGGDGTALLDHLGTKLEIDVAAWWRPTATCYFDRLSKATILALFDEIGGAELRQRYGAAKKHDLAATGEKLFAGEVIVEAEVKAKALAWLPDEMRFGPAPVATVADGNGAEAQVETGSEGEPDGAGKVEPEPETGSGGGIAPSERADTSPTEAGDAASQAA